MFESLIEKGLVKGKSYENGLTVYKYTKRVFYDALWNEDPLLLEARGMVLDAEGNKVIWPFTKVFNHHENGTDLNLDTQVIAPRKVNGFMASARWYHDELVISTTGTLDSEYVALAREQIEKLNMDNMLTDVTYLFEICDPRDPHVIEEEEGAYLIGMRYMAYGKMAAENVLDHEALVINAKRPEWVVCTFGELLKINAECKHEGYMVRLPDYASTTIMKLKSPHYLTKKFLMRMGKVKVEGMFNDPQTFLKTIDEEFYDIVKYITQYFAADVWIAMGDQERRDIIEGHFDMAAQYK